jgi:two-component system KDP operon response regulator KdpE
MTPSPVILIIDDEAQIRRFLRVSLEAAGYRIVEAATGQDGIVQAATSRPNVVILDLGLPDISGLEVLAKIREWSTVPVIVLSVQESPEFRNGHLYVDLVHRLVKVNDQPVKLTAIEYNLLLLFIKHAGKVLTHRQILKEIWGPHTIEQTQYLRVYMAQLRKKLELDPAQPQLFLTESGVGYRMILMEDGG